ncbi:MAG: DUF58 domain-containing protein [Elainellaceae cyanobacterium]
MIPAARLYGLLMIGIAIAGVVAAILPSSIQLIGAVGSVVLYDGVVLAIAGWDARRVRSNKVSVSRLPLQRFSINRDNPVALSVETRTAATLQIRDGYPSDFSVSVPTFKTSLPPSSVNDLTYTVRPTHRGEFKWTDIHVRQLGAWGLAWHQWAVPQVEAVSVYPDLVGLRELTIRLTLQSAGTIRQARRQGMGTEFAELRDYATGDDPRLIDWKATARRNRPLVQVLEPEHEQTLMILLDRGRLMTARVQELSRFDWGLNAALSLAMAGLHRGDRVGVGIFDRTLHRWIPPERGQHHLSHLIETLAPVQPVLLEPDYRGALTTVVTRQTRRALIVVITDIVDPTASIELLTALRQLAPRHLPFCVTLRDPEVDQQASRLSRDVTSAYRQAVALDLLHQRQVAFAELRRKGVLVLDAPANQISDQLVEQYLQLKARNRL